VRVDHRRRNITVAKKLLHRADVVAVLQQMGRERVAEGVAARVLGDSSKAKGAADGALDAGSCK
jgi:hypothetical protein